MNKTGSSMSDTPRLSVVMPMRNSGHCVRVMLDSLLAQKIAMQLVVVDDASEDDSVERVEAWSRQTGQPVEILRNERQLYSYGSRLRGLARASAPVVWCVDADDRIPPNAHIAAALTIMERDKPDILNGRACGVPQDGSLHVPLTWTEPVAERLDGGDIFRIFMAQAYPPGILWNKFFSARLVREVVAMAPDITVRYFDVKFLGLLFLLRAQSYAACNELIYEYRMRSHRPAWLYARQVDALLLLERSLGGLVEKHAPDQAEAFRAYCQRRLVIQSGHLGLMAEAELKPLAQGQGDARDWLERNVLASINAGNLIRALRCSLRANAARLQGWTETLVELCGPDRDAPALNAASPAQKNACPESLPDDLLKAAREWLDGDTGPQNCRRLARCGLRFGLRLAESGPEPTPAANDRIREQALALLLANAQLARAITAIMAPGTDITRKAN